MNFILSFLFILLIYYLISIKKAVGGVCGCDELELVNEFSTELSGDQIEVDRSSGEDLTQMRFESYDLSPPDRSFIQAEEETGKPKRGVTNCLKCWYTNATSLNQEKLDELRAMCADEDFDIIFISETWYRSSSIIRIEGYECFRRDRGDGNGGGVCIYGKTSRSLVFRELDFEQFGSVGIEQVWCAVDVGVESILLGCIYRPEFLRNKGVVCDKGKHKRRDDKINESIKKAGDLVINKKF